VLDAPTASLLLVLMDESPILEAVFYRYVRLVLMARVGNGTWTLQSPLTSFRVILPPGSNAVIQVNGEPYAWSHAVAARAAEAGEELNPDSVLTERVPIPTEPLPFIAGKLTEQGWITDLDLSCSHAQRATHFQAAGEFVDAAEAAVARGAVRAFTENAFHAAELLAKAELLFYPIASDELGGSRKHQRVAATYSLWTRLGNTEPRFAKLLNDLSRIRPTSRYLDGDAGSITSEEAAAWLRTLLAFAEHVDAILHRGAARSFRVVASRDWAAGQLLTSGDGSLRASKR
jgi:hypothetical protein